MVVSLAAHPEYVALSYTWGSPPASCVIEMDGREVRIRKNLWRFFDQFSRSFTILLPIWIDALSIDQTNAAEVRQQISLMARIYSEAIKVMVWLESAKEGKILEQPGGLAIARLCNRAYWTRLWIFQELMLAKHIVLLCGDKAIPWACLTNVMEAPQRQRRQDRNTDNQSLTKSPATLIVQQSKSPLDHRLWELIMANRSLMCSQPRDKVYGLLGVAKLDPGEEITADYQLPLVRLANTILRLHHGSEGVPISIEMVVAQCDHLTDALGLLPGQMYDCVREDAVVELVDVKNGQSCPIGDPTIRGVTSWWAIFYNHPAVERLLAEEGYAKLAPTWKWAVKEGQTSAVRVLLDSARIDPRTRYWRMPDPTLFKPERVDNKNNNKRMRQYDALGLACYYGHEEVVKVLLEYGVVLDGDHEDHRIITPLCAATHGTTARSGDLTIIRFLLAHGAVVNSVCCGDTALCIAAAHGHYSLVQFLLEIGADAKLQAGFRRNALQAAALQGQHEIVQLLLAEGSDVNTCGHGSIGTALQAASYGGHVETVRLLLHGGADPNIRSEGRMSAIHLTVDRARGSIICLNEEGRSQTKEYELVLRLLLERGADPNAEAEKRHDMYRSSTALDASIVYPHYTGTLQILLEAGADVSVSVVKPMREVVRSSPAALKLLVQWGLDVNAPGTEKLREWYSYRDTAASQVPERLAKVLLEKGGIFGTALQVAAAVGNMDSARILLEAGAEVNAPGSVTALGAATIAGRDEIVRLLEEAGAVLTPADQIAVEEANSQDAKERHKHGRWHGTETSPGSL
ncbi:WD repeat-containing protein jip5 [Elasticomyces elasticus]|nr:WD repeat-containing protein jip5 [Elasticomyces elasticus]